MALTAKGTPYVVSTDLVANYPTVSSDLADHIDDNLAYNAVTINAQTGSGANAYTFALADASEGKLVTASNAAAATYTVPPQSSVTWAAGAVLRILNQGAGVVTIAAGSGVTLNGSVLTLNQYEYAEIHRTASNTWTVTGIATPPGLVKVADSTFSAQSTVSINNCFSSTYENYRIVLWGTHSAGSDLNLRWRASGSDNSTANSYITTRLRAVNTTVTGARNTDTFVTFGVLRPETAGGVADVFRPFTAIPTTLTYHTMDSNGGNSADLYLYSGYHNQSTSYDGFTLYVNSGTISGTVRVYGYRN